MTGMVEKTEWSLASKQKYDFQAIRVRISELIPTGAKPRMYRVGRNTLVKALKNRITQASEGKWAHIIRTFIFFNVRTIDDPLYR